MGAITAITGHYSPLCGGEEVVSTNVSKRKTGYPSDKNIQPYMKPDVVKIRN